MSQQIMCWRSRSGSDDEAKILHLWHQGGWRPYYNCPQKVRDYNIPKGSAGYATCQALLKQGWSIIPWKPISPLMPDSEKLAYLDSVSRAV